MKNKTCFVIAPIGEKGSETRKRSDQVLKHIITPSVTQCGYSDPTRADQLAEPGLITSQIIQRILDDALVIADLTERNPNVFYELAVRHAIRKPLVQLIKKGEVIPFDVAGMRTIQFDIQDLDSVDDTKREIIEQIKSVESKPKEMDTPISVSIDLQQLRSSDKPEERSLADVLSVVADLRSSLADIQKRFSIPELMLPPEYLQHVLRRMDIGGQIHPEAVRDLVTGSKRLLKEFPMIKDSESFDRIRRAIDYLDSRMSETRFRFEKEA